MHAMACRAGAAPFDGADCRTVLANIHKYAAGGDAANSRVRDTLGARVSSPAAELVSGLVETNELKRLGCTAAGFGAILKHEWYADAGFDWHALLRRALPAPFVPPAEMPTAEDVDPVVMEEVPFDAAMWQPKFEPFGPTVHVGSDVK